MFSSHKRSLHIMNFCNVDIASQAADSFGGSNTSSSETEPFELVSGSSSINNE